MDLVAENLCFGGRQLRYKHRSTVLACDMHFSIFLPQEAAKNSVPLLYWLSGLTCTDENFVTKAGAQRYAAEHGIAIVAPDTSPRGETVPDDPEGAWDFGKGAGFYLNATEEPWCSHYQMYDYVNAELPELVKAEFPVLHERVAIAGHSMGGHGALTVALGNPDRVCSVSAFSPIVAPSQVPWGEKAFGNYLGGDRDTWLRYDSCELIRGGANRLPMLVDQGGADNFLEEQLQTWRLEKACDESGFPATIRHQAGYDHSYFFIASFIGDHIAFHARNLRG